MTRRRAAGHGGSRAAARHSGTSSYAGTSADPMVVHNLGLAPPSSNPALQCDGDADAHLATRGGGTPAGFVQALEHDFLGRSASPAEVACWTGRLAAGMSRSPWPPALQRDCLPRSSATVSLPVPAGT